MDDSEIAHGDVTAPLTVLQRIIDFVVQTNEMDDPTFCQAYRMFMADDKPGIEGPDDAAHRAVHDVVDHLANGRVTSQAARTKLRGALDKVEAPLSGRAKTDHALGRAIKFGEWSLT